MRILLVDDDELVRNVVSQQLALMKHDITLASSGRQGLEILGTDQFDVVLLDGKMPGFSGIETMAEIARLAAPPPVILMSGFLPDEDHTDLGFSAFLQKPFSQAELASVLTEIS